jgi:uncharacterized protein (DUF488 family)
MLALPFDLSTRSCPVTSHDGCRVFTVGHSTRPIETFLSLLRGHNVTRLIDVRTVPRSRTNPQFNKESLPEVLQEAGISYSHVPELGGLRKPKRDSVNTAWRNLSFRGYADHMQTPEFARALELLIVWTQKDRIALMCAEAVPWRCHRSLIADALTVRGIAVEEILSPTKSQPHKITPFAKIQGPVIMYPGQLPLNFDPPESSSQTSSQTSSKSE